jgi:hypothetical protein
LSQTTSDLDLCDPPWLNFGETGQPPPTVVGANAVLPGGLLTTLVPDGYGELIDAIDVEVRTTRLRAARGEHRAGGELAHRPVDHPSASRPSRGVPG